MFNKTRISLLLALIMLAAAFLLPGIAQAESAELQANAKTWKDAPTITKVVQDGKNITITWKPAKKAKNYVVYDYNTKTKKYVELATVTKATATIKNTVLQKKTGSFEGTHSFAVRPMQKEGGKKVYGNYSAKFKFKVAGLWTLPPKVKASQSGAKVNLTWTVTEAADQYQVFEYDAGTKKYTLLTTVSAKKAALKKDLLIQKTGHYAGTHQFAVRPMKKVSGKKTYGEYSKPVKLFVTISGREQVGDFTYEPTEDGNKKHVRIVDYTGGKKMTVPVKVIEDYYTVTEIGRAAFEGCETLQKVLMADSKVIRIWEGAFRGCVNLKEIDGLPDSLLEIHDWAFENCTSLKDLWIPDQVKLIGFSAFNGTFDNLRPGLNGDTPAWKAAAETFCHYDVWYKDYHLYVDNLVGEQDYSGFLVASNVFANSLTKLPTKIVIPDPIQVIYHGAFCDLENGTMSKLKEVVLPETCGWLGRGAFEGCSALETINLQKVMFYSEAVFKNCTALKDVELSPNTDTIGDHTFENCTSLQLFLPDNIDGNDCNGIGFSAFAGMKDYAVSFNANTDTAKSILGKIFYNFDIFYDDYHLWIKNHEEEGDKYKGFAVVDNSFPLEGKPKPTRIVVPAGIEYIADGAFSNVDGYLDNLTEVVLPDTCGRLDRSAFEGCSALQTINLQKVMFYSESVFKNCTALKDVELSPNTDTIGDHAFENCTSLQLFLPDNIDGNDCNGIGFSAFAGMQDHAVSFNANTDTAKSIIGKIFYNFDIFYDDYHLWIKNHEEEGEYKGFAVLDNSFTNEFAGKPKPTKIIITDGIEYIGHGACSTEPGGGFSEVTEFVLPKSCDKLGRGAFENCAKLETINLEGIRYMDGFVFRGCASLGTVTLGKDIYNIEADTFEGCTNVKLRVVSGTYAEEYAQANGIPYETYIPD